jgi:glucokinase
MRTVGVDLGGTHLRVAVVDADGNVGHEVRVASPAGDWPALVGAVADAVREVMEADAPSGDAIAAVGVGCAALVDDDGVARYAPNVPSLVNAPLRAALADAIGLPVVVDNDANVAAWGELAHGAARGVRHALVLTLGTGIGGGIILDGQVYRGAHGFAAEVGHWQFDPHGAMCACGQPGHWEAEASGTALGGLARAAVGRGDAPSVLAAADGNAAAVTGEHVSQAAEAGAADALALLDVFADRVAVGFAGLANILDPEVIVVSGGLVTLGDVLFGRIRDRFPTHLEGVAYRPEIPIVPAALGDAAGVVGGAVLARSAVANTPA